MATEEEIQATYEAFIAADFPPEVAQQLAVEMHADSAGPATIIGDFASDVPIPGYENFEASARLSDPYTDGSEYEILRRMAPERLVELQDVMTALGVTRNVIPGQLDDATLGGMRTILALSNRAGVQWQPYLQELRRAEAEGELDLDLAGDGRERLPDLYRPPDYSSLAQRVKDEFRSSLKRDPTQAEIRLFTDQLMSDYQVAAEAGAEARQVQEDNVGAGRVVAAPSQVDPISRFRESFESRFRPEMAVMERVEDVQTTAADTQGQIDRAAQIAGV